MQYEASSVIQLAEARHHELQIEAARHGLTRQTYGPALDGRALLAAAQRRLGSWRIHMSSLPGLTARRACAAR